VRQRKEGSQRNYELLMDHVNNNQIVLHVAMVLSMTESESYKMIQFED